MDLDFSPSPVGEAVSKWAVVGVRLHHVGSCTRKSMWSVFGARKWAVQAATTFFCQHLFWAVLDDGRVSMAGQACFLTRFLTVSSVPWQVARTLRGPQRKCGQ